MPLLSRPAHRAAHSVRCRYSGKLSKWDRVATEKVVARQHHAHIRTTCRSRESVSRDCRQTLSRGRQEAFDANPVAGEGMRIINSRAHAARRNHLSLTRRSVAPLYMSLQPSIGMKRGASATSLRLYSRRNYPQTGSHTATCGSRHPM